MSARPRRPGHPSGSLIRVGAVADLPLSRPGAVVDAAMTIDPRFARAVYRFVQRTVEDFDFLREWWGEAS